MDSPLVSVIMPVYNAEKYLREAIDSILNQTCSNFELIIIYDESTDGSKDIISSYKDSRIKVIENVGCQGLVCSLNLGLEYSSGKYIARMDADDISLPERIEKQVSYMESHQETGICGGLIVTFGTEEIKASMPPITSEEIKCALMFETAIPHPTVLMRSEVLNKYHLRYQSCAAEDYDLWVRAIEYCNFFVLPEVLLKYRRTGKSLTAVLNKKETEKKEAYLKIYDILLKRCGLDTSVDSRTLQYRFTIGDRLGNVDIKALKRHLKDVITANSKSRYFNDTMLKNIIGKRWIAYIRRTGQYLNLASVFTLYGMRYIIARLLKVDMLT